ncbi:MAG: hypothetical protein EOM68_12690 [Spirochaetia bacterium]|nr:hypothetical protein [Spirochaetia bacterium]
MIRANTSNEFTRIDAALYRTKIAKRYFLAGEGGSLTVFARRSSDQNASKGAAIIPISEPEARRYAERYGSPKDIKEFFP